MLQTSSEKRRGVDIRALLDPNGEFDDNMDEVDSVVSDHVEVVDEPGEDGEDGEDDNAGGDGEDEELNEDEMDEGEQRYWAQNEKEEHKVMIRFKSGVLVSC